MKKYTVKQYQSEDFGIWNEFVANAKNATFLFHRDFMEYHSDRFHDFSLLIFDEKQNLKAILPANRVGDTLFSHQGLTYGGLVFEKTHNSVFTSKIMDDVFLFLKVNGVKEVQIKIIPTIYSEASTQEFDHYLFSSGARLSNREMNLIIDLRNTWNLSKSKLKHFRKVDLNLEIREESDFSLFWESVLTPRLSKKFNSKPVHSLSEIQYLKNKFNSNIMQFSAYYNKELVAGITIFKFGNVVKSQYGATTNAGEKVRALDFLFITLIEKFRKEGDHYFDMGTVANNEGLLNQKVELGCSVYNNDFYTMKL